MKNTTPLNIRVVANGYIVGERVAADYLCGQEHVFVAATDLAAFVAQFYAENHPQANAVPSATVTTLSEQAEIAVALNLDHDPVHNPDNLSDEVVGVADGWRLLRKSEIHQRRESPMREIEQWHCNHSKWNDGSYFGCETDYTYRTKVPYGQLDAEGASK